MKEPAFQPPCRACGRDLVGTSCPVCDVEAAEPVVISPSRRVFECVSRHPGLGSCELAELLGSDDQTSLEQVAQMLVRLARRGALRFDGPRNERLYYPADEAKLPRVREVSAGRAASKNKKAKRSLKRYHRLRKEGRCVSCGKQRSPGDKSLCSTCRERKRWVRSAEARPAGACSSCGCTMLAEWKFCKQCPECREKHRERRKRWRQNPAVRGRLRAKQKVRDDRRRQRLKGKGLCRDCERPSTGYRCQECGQLAYLQNADRIRQLRLERTANGLCISCNEPVVPGKRGCEKHLKAWAESQRRTRERRAA